MAVALAADLKYVAAAVVRRRRGCYYKKRAAVAADQHSPLIDRPGAAPESPARYSSAGAGAATSDPGWSFVRNRTRFLAQRLVGRRSWTLVPGGCRQRVAAP